MLESTGLSVLYDVHERACTCSDGDHGRDDRKKADMCVSGRVCGGSGVSAVSRPDMDDRGSRTTPLDNWPCDIRGTGSIGA